MDFRKGDLVMDDTGIAERVARIAYYESLLRQLQRALSYPEPSEHTRRTAAKLAESLSDYYASDDWKADFAADEAGELPADLPRGSLSEDGIYHALEDYREWAQTEQIETERLILRRLQAEDLELIYRLYSDPEILRYSPFDTMDYAGAEAYVQHMLDEWEKPSPDNREYTVVRKEDGTPVGRCHIEPDSETDTAMVGCHLLKDYWRQGYAAEICRALVAYSFETLGVHRVNALCNPENTGSRKMLEACGMRLEAHFRKKCRYVKGGVTTWQDELQYAILREEWKADHEARR